MIRRKIAVLVLTGSLAIIAATAQETSSKPGNPQSGVLPLTTKSAQVRQLVEQAWVLALDQVEQQEAAEVLQKAVAIDPTFAMGHELLAQTSLDPAEQVKEQRQAFLMRSHAGPAEQLVIDWYQNAADHKLIPAITKMNELLSQYPHDKWVVYLANWWLTQQTQYERAAAVYEHSGITDSPGLMNNTAYTYAYMRQFDKAFALMDQYIAALPRDPNPQDSYAEILRLAGHFDQSIEHYREALAIDSGFYSSQFGIADTYSLMGDQVRARQEYEIGFQKFPLPELHRIQWQTREAITFVREEDYQKADRAFLAIAKDAHGKNQSQVEADTYRLMAMYQKDPKRALVLLNKADAAARVARNALPAAIAQERAQILRARVELAVRSGDQQTANVLLARLSKMSESSNDKIIETADHGAQGAALFSEHKYKDAIPYLEDDINNPLSLNLLATAYQKAGDAPEAKHTTETLVSLNDPTLEQALIVPAFRKCYEDPSCSSGFKNAALKK